VLSTFAKVRLRNVLAFTLLISIALIPCQGPFSPSYAARGHLAKVAISQESQMPSHKAGEVLVRFKGGSSENLKNIVAATYRVGRKKQLRGESAIEKLDVLSGDDAASVAAQLKLNPQIEFAEPNFIITKAQVNATPNDPRFSEQWAIKNTGQNGGQYGSDIGVATIWGKTTGAQSAIIAVIIAALISLTRTWLTMNGQIPIPQMMIFTAGTT
jgi:hypothetical protein